MRCDLDGNEYPGCQYADTLIEGEGHPVAQYRYGYGKRCSLQPGINFIGLIS